MRRKGNTTAYFILVSPVSCGQLLEYAHHVLVLFTFHGRSHAVFVHDVIARGKQTATDYVVITVDYCLTKIFLQRTRKTGDLLTTSVCDSSLHVTRLMPRLTALTSPKSLSVPLSVCLSVCLSVSAHAHHLSSSHLFLKTK